MDTHDHTPNARGSTYLWGGVTLGALLLAALLTRGFGLLGGGRSGPEETPLIERRGERIFVPAGSPLRERLGLIKASAEAVTPRLVLPAVIESDPARTVPVLTPLAGRVIELKVALGDRVAAGQVLAILDSADLGQAYDDDEKAAAAFGLADRNLTRQEGQAKIGAASERDLDQARSDRNQAEAEYRRTRARLKMLAVADAPGEHPRALILRAPLAGSITALSVARGNMVNDTTQPLLTLADLSTVWVTALVPEKDVAALAKDQEAEVALEAYPGQVRRGKVLFVADVIEPDTRRNKLRIAFANTDHALKPNMFATVTLHGAPTTRVVLPTSALLMNNDRTSVYVETAPWTFERRTVELRLEEGASVAIEAGVKPGEEIVAKGAILLND